MTEIPATLVKQLREKTSAGMMDCKKALVETGGNFDAAIDVLRRKGEVRLVDLHDREANEGRIGIYIGEHRSYGKIVEVKCETDFVARNEGFVNLVDSLAAEVADYEEIATFGATVGENVSLSRYHTLHAHSTPENPAAYGSRIFGYQHSNGKLAVLVGVECDLSKSILGRDLAMHIAASSPTYISRDQVPADVVQKEREFLLSQPDLASKPENIRQKMVDGRLNKFYAGICLEEQQFVKDTSITVKNFLSQNGLKVESFVRMEIGKNRVCSPSYAP